MNKTRTRIHQKRLESDKKAGTAENCVTIARVATHLTGWGTGRSQEREEPMRDAGYYDMGAQARITDGYD